MKTDVNRRSTINSPFRLEIYERKLRVPNGTLQEELSVSHYLCLRDLTPSPPPNRTTTATDSSSATIVLLVALGVAATLFTAPPTVPPASSPPRSTMTSTGTGGMMRDMAVGTDDEALIDEVIIPVKETEERLERLLSGVKEGKSRDARRREKDKEKEIDRI